MKKALQFRLAFRWEKEVEDYIREHIEGYSLNVPCGQSEIGDVRVDLDPEMGKFGRDGHDFRIAEMTNLPFVTGTFDTVISDPPWSLNIFGRPKQFFEIFRVYKVGGLIIFNATWLPSSKFDLFRYEEIRVRQSTTFANTSLLILIRKVAEVPV